MIAEVQTASGTRDVAARRALLLIVVVAALLSVLLRVLPAPRTIDDAFITFRYSRNLVEGHGFVYNPGVRTIGTTTPLYTLLMAAIGALSGSGSYPWFALVTNALADGLTAALLALLGWRVTGRLAVAAVLGAVWAVSPMSVTFAIGGMETSVVILWMVAAFYAYAIGRAGWMAVFTALGILTRIDALLWVGPLLLHQFYGCWRRPRPRGAGIVQRFPWRTWLLTAALLTPWYLFSWRYFGTLLSNSLSAKRVAYAIEEWNALTRLLQHIATPFFEESAFGAPGIAVGLLLYPGLAMIGLFYVGRRVPRLLPFAVYPWVYVAAFSLMNPVIFRWYLAPPLSAYFFSIVVGLWALLDAFAGRRLTALAVSAAGAAFVALSLNVWTLHPDHGPDRPAPEMAWHQIELYYRDMAELLRSDYDVDENTLVAAGDIGAVGYYSRARILDTVGLITPEMSDYYPLDPSLLIPGSNYAVPPQIVEDYRPAYLVVMEAFVRNGLARDPAFTARYDEVAFIPTDFYGRGMILYARHDAAASVAAAPVCVASDDWRGG